MWWRSRGFWQGLIAVSAPAVAFVFGLRGAGLFVLLGLVVVYFVVEWAYQRSIQKIVRGSVALLREATGREMIARGLGLTYYILTMRRALRLALRELEAVREEQRAIIRGLGRLECPLALISSDGRVMAASAGAGLEPGSQLQGKPDFQFLWDYVKEGKEGPKRLEVFTPEPKVVQVEGVNLGRVWLLVWRETPRGPGPATGE